MDDTFHVNKITLDGTHKTPPCAIARFYSCTTILCILRSKDIAPIHGIAHGRMDRDNVHAPEAVTLPMGVKATGALGEKKGRGGHARAPHPAPTTLPSSPASANTHTDIPKPNRAYRPPPLSASRSNISLLAILLLPPLSIPSFHSPPRASTPRFPIGVGEEAEHAARSRVPRALLGQRE
jgi:hypothetical protein